MTLWETSLDRTEIITIKEQTQTVYTKSFLCSKVEFRIKFINLLALN